MKKMKTYISNNIFDSFVEKTIDLYYYYILYLII